MNARELMDTARTLVAADKGLLAMDESTPTCNRRFARLGIPETEDARRAYREMIVSTPGLGGCISGAILYDETIRQRRRDGTPFAVADDLPSRGCIDAIAQTPARYAALCQEASLVPVVEPEALMDGAHTLERCAEVTEEVLRAVFIHLYTQRVMLEGLILKPNMVLPGLTCPKQEGVDAVVFTGGIGENSARVRRDATSALGFAGLELAEDANVSDNSDRDIAVPGSRVRILVVRAREDLAILKDVLRLRHAELPISDAKNAGRNGGVPAVRAAIARWENEGGAPRPGHSSIELDPRKKKVIVFDLDGTLAESKASLDAEMATLLDALLPVVKVAVISGGGWPQFETQLLSRLSADELLRDLSLLPTCGTQFFHYASGWIQRYAETLSNEEKKLIVHSLKETMESSGFRIEATWGEQIEDRGSQITFSALGQQAPIGEKEKWDPDFAKRRKMQARLEQLLPGFSVRLGGTTSVNVTKLGIDKGYGIRKLRDTLGIGLHEMLFIGDALFPGGNHYPAKEAGVESIQVRDPNETKRVIAAILACVGRVRHTRLGENDAR